MPVLLSTFLILGGIACTAGIGSKNEVIKLTIPYPSGIQVDKVTNSAGREFRFGRLQHNSIEIRPHWSSINVVEDVFSVAECKDIINRAETHASKFGWSQGRHVDYDIRPTQDLPVDIIYDNPTDIQALYDRFASKIWPDMASKFNLNPAMILPTDLFITKYNSSRRENVLGPHQDKSPFSFVIPLNDQFVGGGTYFFETESLWVPPVGAALYFNGNHLHGGSPTTDGIRYILAGFCEYGASDHSGDVSSPEAHTAFMSMYDPRYDGTAAQSGFRSGDLIVGLEVCKSVTDNCIAGAEPSLCATWEGTMSSGFVREKVDITGYTTDEEWVKFAQSCELLDPNRTTVMWVRRKDR